ncbi:MAG: hypothetical protein WC319_15445 [Candidatus Paceibacterota bacterium]|jgi:hypothetical protein
MKEIDLKVTPLSEIDLERIDYEKSYVVSCNNNIQVTKIIYNEDNKKTWNIHTEEAAFTTYHFNNNGRHMYNPEGCTLHLFYKELRDCENCRFTDSSNDEEPCKSCEGSNWQPIEEISISKGWMSSTGVCVKSNPHPIVIEFQNLGDTVKIVKIEGVMAGDEIKTHAGKKVLDDYFIGAHMFFNKGLLIVKDKDGYYMAVESNMKISKKAFLNLIETMKLASKRLAELIKETPKIERIEI